mmetsp:Transcript_83003/g.130553  ORF Transcript_83003/g.130553 Transcript_83003/m.130553 type:complete len:423 (+) Transcript_83003:54-1322(+)
MHMPFMIWLVGNVALVGIALAFIVPAIIITSYLAMVIVKPHRYPRIIGGRSSKMQKILSSIPLLQSCPRGPLDFSTTLQLIVFALQGQWQERNFEKDYVTEDETITVTLPGRSAEKGDDVVSIRWICRETNSAPRELPEQAPIVLLCPGLNCYTASLPGTAIYSVLLQHPWRVGVFEKRGVGPSAGSRFLQMPVFHMFGHPSDLHEAVLQIQKRFPGAPLYLVGISSGNGLVGSYSTLYGNEATSLRSSMLLIGGEDYNCAFRAPRSTWLTRMLFDVVLLGTSKARYLEKNAKVLRSKNEDAWNAAHRSMTHQQFYDIVMRHFSGYSDPDEAESRINAFSGGCENLRNLAKPFLYVCTEDDPVAPGGPRESWVSVIKQCENAALAYFPCGSHLACYDSLRLTRWLDQLVVQWIDAFELVSKE